MKRFLLIDLAQKRQAVALANQEKLLALKSWQFSPLKPTDPLRKIDQLLKHNHNPPSKLSGVIINQGPGSFTSLRTAAAIVNSLNLALALPLAGVNRFEIGALRASLQDGWVIIPTNLGDFFVGRIKGGRLLNKPLVLASSQLKKLRGKLVGVGIKKPISQLSPGACLLPARKKEELISLLRLGQKRLRLSKRVLTPLYGRPIKITLP